MYVDRHAVLLRASPGGWEGGTGSWAVSQMCLGYRQTWSGYTPWRHLRNMKTQVFSSTHRRVTRRWSSSANTSSVLLLPSLLSHAAQCVQEKFNSTLHEIFNQIWWTSVSLACRMKQYCLQIKEAYVTVALCSEIRLYLQYFWRVWRELTPTVRLGGMCWLDMSVLGCRNAVGLKKMFLH